MVCNLFMLRSLCISLMIWLIKFAPQSVKNLDGTPKIEMYPWYKNLATVFAFWLEVTYTITCFMKWSWNTRMLATLGGLFMSIVVSIVIKSICKRSIGAVDTMGCRCAWGCWHPLSAATWCALGTTKSKRISVLPLGVEHTYRAPGVPWNSVYSV